MTMIQAASPAVAKTRPINREEMLVIFASSLGTVFEWYDFFLYGALASIIGAQFFSAYPQAARNIFALLAFAAGFIVRPFGALVFGRLGDLVGRKYTFLVTILIMGLSTFVVGVLPNAKSIGIAAPIILIVARLAQGLALGGEYGGAATYVAEHAPKGRRGFYTSWIQMTATAGLFLSLLVILASRSILGEDEFKDWGWRLPFIVSVLLLAVSLWIRLKLSESPVFLRMKEHGTTSKAPLTEAFGHWGNVKVALAALFGLVAGETVIWYTAQFYVLFFLQTILKVDGYTANLLSAWSLLFGCGFFVFFGWLSDKIGRKKIILAGCALGALTMFPTFQAITAAANPKLQHAIETVKVVVEADPATCHGLFNPVGTRVFSSPCDVARDFLAKSSVRYETASAASGQPAVVKINGRGIVYAAEASTQANKLTTDALQQAGYPKPGDSEIVKMSNPFDLFRPGVIGLVGLLFLLLLFGTMTYGPLAAILVELFPTRIRYTSLSLPYHIANGWIGGLLPAASFAMVAQTGDIYFGLWYPIAFAILTVVVGILFVPETKDRDIFSDV